MRDPALLGFIGECIRAKGMEPRQIVRMIDGGRTGFPRRALTVRAISRAIDHGQVPGVDRAYMLQRRK